MKAKGVTKQQNKEELCTIILSKLKKDFNPIEEKEKSHAEIQTKLLIQEPIKPLTPITPKPSITIEEKVQVSQVVPSVQKRVLPDFLRIKPKQKVIDKKIETNKIKPISLSSSVTSSSIKTKITSPVPPTVPPPVPTKPNVSNVPPPIPPRPKKVFLPSPKRQLSPVWYHPENKYDTYDDNIHEWIDKMEEIGQLGLNNVYVSSLPFDDDDL